jgi:hypothetical protein
VDVGQSWGLGKETPHDYNRLGGFRSGLLDVLSSSLVSWSHMLGLQIPMMKRERMDDQLQLSQLRRKFLLEFKQPYYYNV